MKKLLLTLASVATLAVGCRHGVNTVENAYKTNPPNAIVDARFITDARLAHRIVLRQVNTGRTQAGLLTVQLDAVNMHLGKLPIHLKYKFDWFDGQGLRVDTFTSAWQEKTVLPGENFILSATAPRPDSADFKVSLTQAR